MLIYAKPYLRELILRRGNSVASFAEEVGISRQGMYMFLNRRNGMSPDKTKKIAELLNAEFDEILEIIEVWER